MLCSDWLVAVESFPMTTDDEASIFCRLPSLSRVYTSVTKYTDGSTVEYPYCERPHLIFDQTGDPIVGQTVHLFVHFLLVKSLTSIIIVMP
eukprot:SAG31_NODE_8037_length_1536_cov_1.149617_1_plen_90_part_10